MVVLRIPASYKSHGTGHCHKREPVSITAVYMHAKSIFKDKSISVHLRTHWHTQTQAVCALYLPL